eukprot:403332385
MQEDSFQNISSMSSILNHSNTNGSVTHQNRTQLTNQSLQNCLNDMNGVDQSSLIEESKEIDQLQNCTDDYIEQNANSQQQELNQALVMQNQSDEAQNSSNSNDNAPRLETQSSFEQNQNDQLNFNQILDDQNQDEDNQQLISNTPLLNEFSLHGHFTLTNLADSQFQQQYRSESSLNQSSNTQIHNPFLMPLHSNTQPMQNKHIFAPSQNQNSSNLYQSHSAFKSQAFTGEILKFRQSLKSYRPMRESLGKCIHFILNHSNTNGSVTHQNRTQLTNQSLQNCLNDMNGVDQSSLIEESKEIDQLQNCTDDYIEQNANSQQQELNQALVMQNQSDEAQNSSNSNDNAPRLETQSSFEQNQNDQLNFNQILDDQNQDEDNQQLISNTPLLNEFSLHGHFTLTNLADSQFQQQYRSESSLNQSSNTQIHNPFLMPLHSNTQPLQNKHIFAPSQNQNSSNLNQSHSSLQKPSVYRRDSQSSAKSLKSYRPMRESLGKMHTFVDKLFKDSVSTSKVLERDRMSFANQVASASSEFVVLQTQAIGSKSRQSQSQSHSQQDGSLKLTDQQTVVQKSYTMQNKQPPCYIESISENGSESSEQSVQNFNQKDDKSEDSLIGQDQNLLDQSLSEIDSKKKELEILNQKHFSSLQKRRNVSNHVKQEQQSQVLQSKVQSLKPNLNLSMKKSLGNLSQFSGKQTFNQRFENSKKSQQATSSKDFPNAKLNNSTLSETSKLASRNESTNSAQILNSLEDSITQPREVVKILSNKEVIRVEQPSPISQYNKAKIQTQQKCSMPSTNTQKSQNCGICKLKVLIYQRFKLMSCGHKFHQECLNDALKAQQENLPLSNNSITSSGNNPNQKSGNSKTLRNSLSANNFSNNLGQLSVGEKRRTNQVQIQKSSISQNRPLKFGNKVPQTDHVQGTTNHHASNLALLESLCMYCLETSQNLSNMASGSLETVIETRDETVQELLPNIQIDSFPQIQSSQDNKEIVITENILA